MAFVALFISACGEGEQIGDTQDPVTAAPFYPDPAEEWVLVWSDEFDGDSLDTSKWGYDLGDGSDRGLNGWGNRELQWYTDRNATVSDGTLKITAQAETVGDYGVTSSRITTKGKLDIQYGRVEASIRAPGGAGMWSAFWMLPTNSPYASEPSGGAGAGGGWAATGEIDIFEAINPGAGGDLDFTGATIYHGFPWPLQQFLNTRFEDLDATAGFNTYAVEWEADELRFFYNDTHVKTISSQAYYSYYYDSEEGYQTAPDGAPFDTPFHLILNLAVGGNATGITDLGGLDTAVLPGAMEVDYVRVYSCAYNLPDGSGCNVNNNRTLESPPANRPFEDSFDIFIDEGATYTWRIAGEVFERSLAVNSFFDNGGALTFAEVAATDRGNVIDVVSTGGGNISINPTDPDPISLFGMGNNPNFAELFAGELTFDILVRSADAGSEFLIKMDSGYPALGQVALPADSFTPNTWTSVSVKLNDLIAFRGDGLQPLDTSNIVSMFVFEPTGAASVQLDNIRLSCGIPGQGDCGISAPVPPAPPITGPFRLAGTWRLAPEAGALGVGPVQGDISWFSTTEDDLDTRGCHFDDDYVFGLDGSFQNVLGDDTWLEIWQSGVPEACGVPVAPHDGTATDYTFDYDEGAGTLTLNGTGAHLGLPKAVNGSELSDPASAPSSVTYFLEEVGNDRMIVSVNSGTESAPIWWQFVLIKTLDADAPAGPSERTFAGTWQITPVAGALGVGPAQGDISWWSSDEATITTRACFWDDEYVFDRDGTFMNVLGDETWLETWQAAEESCGTPVTPHDGLGAFTWSYDEGTSMLTLNGTGAYMGIPKAVNAGELPAVAVPDSVTYMVEWITDDNVIIDIETGTDVWWRFDMTKTVQPPPAEGGDSSPLVGSWRVAPEAGSLGVGPAQGDISWWSADDSTPTTRACFYDDNYVFNADGTFTNELDGETWLETWQGPAEECGTPVAPHDGLGVANWTFDAETGMLTLDGLGNYLGIPKAVNAGELPAVDVPSSVTYMVTFEDDNRMIVDIETGTDVWWRFVMIK
jgi:beta-glucanase (GH16 family)